MATEQLKIVGTAEALNNTNAYKTLLKSNGFSLLTDEPIAVGGTGEAAAPGDYLCMALSACKAITLRMYVQRKQWQVGEIDVKVNLVKTQTASGPIHTFLCEISVTGEVSGEQKERLVQIAKACPISKLLEKGSEVVTVMKQ